MYQLEKKLENIIIKENANFPLFRDSDEKALSL